MASSGVDPPESRERERRQTIWSSLSRLQGFPRITPSQLRDWHVYSGQAGIFVDVERTRGIAGERRGVTVSVRHTGERYADELSETSLRYHYPLTRRRGHDAAEIEATKNAAKLHLPLFAVLPDENPRLRLVKLGWVRSSDDAGTAFLIDFSDEPLPPLPSDDFVDEQPFDVGGGRTGRRWTTYRPDQPVFSQEVFLRYGARCAVCSNAITDVLQAAHIQEVRDNGGYDPRNGLVLCANHHLAFDGQLFGIHPETLAISLRPSGPTAKDLELTQLSIAHLRKKPAQEALRWRWVNKWTSSG